MACKVHPSTICLALKDAPSIPLATRRRIQETAASMGYRPNAAARNLAFLRTEKTQAGGSLPLAWLNQEPTRDFWRRDPEGIKVYAAARQRAAALGYVLTDLWAAEPGLRPARLAEILRARGIEGVMCPVAGAMRPELFETLRGRFCTMALGDYRAGEWLDVVCGDYYHNLEIALSWLDQAGAANIGLVLDPAFDAASGGLVRSRYLSFQHDGECLRDVPQCVLGCREDAHGDLLAWWHRHRPEAVVCGGRGAAAIAQDVLAKDVTVVCLETSDSGCQQIDDRSEIVAMYAVERLAAKVQGRDQRFGEDTQRSLVKGHVLTPSAPAMTPRQAVAV